MSDAQHASEALAGFHSPRTAATLVGALAGAVTYTLCVLLHLPTPRYFPVTRVWDLGPHAGTISMGYYGNLLVAALALGVAYAIGRVPAVARGLSRPAPARILAWLTPIAVAACLVLQLGYELIRWSGR